MERSTREEERRITVKLEKSEQWSCSVVSWVSGCPFKWGGLKQTAEKEEERSLGSQEMRQSQWRGLQERSREETWDHGKQVGSSHVRPLFVTLTCKDMPASAETNNPAGREVSNGFPMILIFSNLCNPSKIPGSMLTNLGQSEICMERNFSRPVKDALTRVEMFLWPILILSRLGKANSSGSGSSNKLYDKSNRIRDRISLLHGRRRERLALWRSRLRRLVR